MSPVLYEPEPLVTTEVFVPGVDTLHEQLLIVMPALLVIVTDSFQYCLWAVNCEHVPFSAQLPSACVTTSAVSSKV